MFEGFPDGPWGEETDSPESPPPEWWEILGVVAVLGFIGYSLYQLAVYGF